MASTETARLERETEETRAEVERTLFELRARMSPGQLLDQASDYFRHSSGRAFLGNLRDQVVGNPLPVTLIGAGIAWLALSGTIGRRRDGNGRRQGNGRAWNERDWGETAARAGELAENGDEPGAAERARQAAEGWAEDAREAASDAGDAIVRARQAAEGWAEGVRTAASDAGDTLRDAAGELRDQASNMYDGTVRGSRRMAGKAADYGRAARHAVEPNGALMNFCREQPMLVAGLGIAVGAALGALLPTSRPERRIMGEASQDMRERATQAAAEGLRAATSGGESDGSDRSDGERTGNEADPAANDIDLGVDRASQRPHTENEPQGAAPYAEAPEAGAASAPGTTDARQPG